MRIETKEVKERLPSTRARSTLDLIRDGSADAKSELVWRAGLPLSAFVLSLLAIPLSFVNPRAGRSLNLMVAALVYMVYNNLLSIVQAWVAQEKIPAAVGMWGLHVLLFALVAFLFYLRLSVFSLSRFRSQPQ